MKIASITEVEAILNQYVKASEEEIVIITRNGKPIAVLLPLENDNLENIRLAYPKNLQALLIEARNQIKNTGGIPHDVFWQEIEEQPER